MLAQKRYPKRTIQGSEADLSSGSPDLTGNQTEEDSQMNTLSRVTRRRLLKDTGLALLAAGSAPVLSTPFISRAMADTKTLSVVQWSHFVPAYDKWFDNFAKDWGTKNHIEVTVDHIPVADVAARAAAEASA